MNYINLNITKEVKYEGFDVFIEGNDKDNNNTCFIKRLILSIISYNNQAFSNNISKL
jgi:hypothetical protein